MKAKVKLGLVLIIALLTFFLTSNTSAALPASECATKIWKKFQSDIKYPEFAQKMALQGEVTIVFSISDEGGIIVKDVRATDSDLGNYIRSTVAGVKCPELKEAGAYEFKVKFHFRLI
jgi:hypothetical protein